MNSDFDCYAIAHVGGGPGLQDGEWLEVGEAALPIRPDHCEAREFEAYDLNQEKVYLKYDGPTLQVRVEQPLCIAADIDDIAIGNAEVLDCSKLSLDMSAVSDSIEGVLLYEYLTLNTETIEFTIRHSFNNQSCIETKPRALWYPRTEEECQDSWDMYVAAGGDSDFAYL